MLWEEQPVCQIPTPRNRKNDEQFWKVDPITITSLISSSTSSILLALCQLLKLAASSNNQRNSARLFVLGVLCLWGYQQPNHGKGLAGMGRSEFLKNKDTTQQIAEWQNFQSILVIVVAEEWNKGTWTSKMKIHNKNGELEGLCKQQRAWKITNKLVSVESIYKSMQKFSHFV